MSERVKIITIGSGVFFSIMSTSMLAIAAPDLVQHLGVGYSVLQWRFELFFTIFALCLPLWGQVADRIGPRKQFLLGLGLFAAGSAGSALVHHWALFLGFQTLQAIADSMLVPAIMSLIRRTFPEERMGWAFGWFGATLTAASLCGPGVGGLVLQYLPLSALFWILFAGSAATLLVAARVLPSLAPTRPGAPLPLMGTGLLLTAALALQVGISPTSGVRLRLVAFAVALLAGAAFGMGELRGVTPRIFPAGMWGNAQFVGACVRMFLLFLSTNILSLMGPTYLREVHRISPGVVGAMLVVAEAWSMVLLTRTGALADRNGMRSVAMGIAISILGMIVFAWTPPPAMFWMLSIGLLVSAVGGSLSSPALDRLAATATPLDESGAYMGVFQMFQHSSGAFAAVLLGLFSAGAEGGVSLEGYRKGTVVAVLASLGALVSVGLDFVRTRSRAKRLCEQEGV